MNPAQQRGNRRILVIDDQRSILDDFLRILSPEESSPALDWAKASLFGPLPPSPREEAAFTIDVAAQGEEGLALVEAAAAQGRPYSLAFVDVRMPPGWDGIETVERIWQVDPDMLVVICTAHADYSWEEIVRRLGRVEQFLILKKPFDPIEIRHLAASLTEKWELARTDPRTGVLNRPAFYQRCRREWQHAAAWQRPLAVGLINIEGLAKINAAQGTATGDAALARVAQVIRDHLSPTDAACRYGGDEFCALLVGRDEGAAARWAARVHADVEALPSAAADAPPLRVRIGIAARREDVADPQMLVDCADRALAAARRGDLGPIVVWQQLVEAPDSATIAARDPFRGLMARQVMTTPVISLWAEAPLRQAADFFLQTRADSAPVVDEEGAIVGLISEQDVLPLLQSRQVWSRPVREAMRTDPVCYGEETPVREVYDFLLRSAIRRVVVVRQRQPVGVISRAALLRWFGNWGMAGALQANEEDDAVRKAACDRCRHNLSAVSSSLADLLAELRSEGQPCTEDPVPPAVQTATRLQDLADELLSVCQVNCVFSP